MPFISTAILTPSTFNVFLQLRHLLNKVIHVIQKNIEAQKTTSALYQKAVIIFGSYFSITNKL